MNYHFKEHQIDYDTLTIEQLEEHVEFIDWSLVSSCLITDEIKKSFSSLPGLKARLWLENLLNKMVFKEDQVAYPNAIFFFIGDEYYMEFNLKNGRLWCSQERVWSVFKKKVKFRYYDEIKFFIKNIVEQHSIFLKIESISTIEEFRQIEQHFKDKTIKPEVAGDEDTVEKYFKDKIKKPKIAKDEDVIKQYFKDRIILSLKDRKILPINNVSLDPLKIERYFNKKK